MPRAAVHFVAFVLGLTACEATLPGKSCTTLGCEQGARIDFSYREPGAYVFEVTVDGTTTTCRAALPVEPNPTGGCDGPNVFLSLVGSAALPADQHSVGGIFLGTTSASSVTVKATRDGATLGEKTFALDYRVAPGPNGPDCDPKECRLATATFP